MKILKSKLFIICGILTCFQTTAQTVVSDFEALSLPASSYYQDTTGADFTNGNVLFQYDWDMNWQYWSAGFSYSNIQDSVTSGFSNLYACKANKGYASSANYVIGQNNAILKLQGASVGQIVQGFYVCNSTYAHNSMRDGDAFAKKFGGVTGNDPDWFKLTVKKYYNGILTTDSAEYYLADFRFSNNANDYILKDWQWFDLTPLGPVDSLQFNLSSSDNGAFGMNTPAFFCMDNLTCNQYVGINENAASESLLIYPNPTHDILNLSLGDTSIEKCEVYNFNGSSIEAKTRIIEHGKLQLDCTDLQPGLYTIVLRTDSGNISKQFIVE